MVGVFEELVSEMLTWTTSRIDDELRELELARRALEGRWAAALAAAEARQVAADDGHRSTQAYLRATTNQPRADRQLARARLCRAFPAVGDALLMGRVGMAQVDVLARLVAHPRVGALVSDELLSTLLEHAEHFSYHDFTTIVDRWRTLADQDGSLRDATADHERRNATIDNVDGMLHVHVTGGDPLTAERITLIFDQACEAEYRHDPTARRDAFGDDADSKPLPRTSWQRRYDALVRIFDLAAQHLDAPVAPSSVCVNVLIDQATLHRAFAQDGILLPGGHTLDPDDLGTAAQREALLAELCDPERLLDWRCKTASGHPVHPRLVVQALLGGHVRSVLVNDRREVVEVGSSRRLFTGLWAVAAHLARPRCEHPGCGVPGHLCQIDHRHPWAHCGPTSQPNSAVLCAAHNRLKHSKGWRSGRAYNQRLITIRSDGTLMLPAGERPPPLATTAA